MATFFIQSDSWGSLLAVSLFVYYVRPIRFAFFFIPDQIDRSGRTPATLLIWKCYDSCVVSSDRQNRTVQFLIKSFTGISYPVSSAFSHVVYYNSLGRGY